MKNEWDIEQWDDVLEIRSGRNQKQVIDPNGSYPIIGSSGKTMGYANDYLCEANTTIIGRKGTIDKPLYIETRFWNVDTAFGLVAGEKLESRFLHYFCLNYDFREHNKGTTLPSLVKKDLVKIEIPIPPLPKQEEIVEILDKAFAAIDQAKANLEQNIANAKELFQSALQSAFEQTGEEWVKCGKPLNELCELIIDCEHKTAPTQDEGIPSIRTPNIGSGELILENVRRVSNETFEKWTRRGKPQPGDLILAREAPAGNVAVIPEGLQVCLGQRTVLIRPLTTEFVPQFLALHILEPKTRARLLAHSTGATVQHVNMRDIRALTFPFLPPLESQKAIVAKLDALSSQIRQLESHYQTKLASLDELKKSILQKAFAGELT